MYLKTLFIVGLSLVTVTCGKKDKEAPEPGSTGSMSISNLKRDTLTLSWAAATDNKSDATELKYRVYQSTNADMSDAKQLVDATASLTSGKVSGLSANTKYYFNVFVEDEKKNEKSYTVINTTTLKTHIGIWTASCVKSGSGASATYSTTVYTFADDSTTGSSKWTYYSSDSTCQTPLIVSDTTFTYTLSTDELTSPSGAYKIDETVKTYTFTPKTDAIATSYAGICGTATWTKDTAVDCKSAFLPGGKTFDIIKSSMTALTLGDATGTNNGSSEALRPTSLNTTTAFTFTSNN